MEENRLTQKMPKRTIKDSVFTDLFRDKKYLLQLYKALHPEDISVTEDDIEDITINHVLVDGEYNDLGFSVAGRLMVLAESQSTWSYNIIIRILIYLVQTYHDYFQRTNQNLYGSKKVNIPRPELYMIYMGDRKTIPDTISLSEDFFRGEEISIDVKVKILYQENEEDIIGQYIMFCKVYNEQRKLHGRTEKAVRETIRICRDRNVLREYLEKREKEVVNMMMTLFEEEQIMKAYTKSMIEEGREEGRKEGKAEGICILIEALKGLGQSRVFILSKLLSEYGLSEVEASKYL